MNNQEIIEKLSSLVQLDIDASYAYGQAIESIDHQELVAKLTAFRGDHERHITEFSTYIRSLGGEAPSYSRDFKGFLIQGYTAIRSAMGIEGALKAMQSNEQLTNSTYKSVLELDLPKEVQALVQRNYEDEQKHIKYIEEVLKDKSWERT